MLYQTVFIEDNMSNIATTPEPPYYAVIFTSIRKDGDNGYADMAELMISLAKKQPGFLGIEETSNDIGITVSYWTDRDSIQQWKENSEHIIAQNNGRTLWYEAFKTRICKVERDYQFNSSIDN